MKFQSLFCVLRLFANIAFFLQRQGWITIIYDINQILIVFSWAKFFIQIIPLGYLFKKLNEDLERTRIRHDIIKPVSKN